MDEMRITRDWNEVTGEWSIHRKWPFSLKVLEEVEMHWPLAASARQIWFEIQVKLGYVDWTGPSEDLWKSAFRSVLKSSYELLMKQIVQELDSTGELGTRKLPSSGFWYEDLVPDPEDEHVSICSAESGSMHMVDLSDVMADEVQSARVSFPSILAQGNAFPSFLAQDSIIVVEAADVKTRETRWRPINGGIVPQYFPGSVDEYLSSKQDIEKVRSHLAFLRYRIETAMFETVRKWRYISPAGHVSYSLRQVCQNLQSRATNPQTVCREPKPRNAGLIAAPVVQLSVMKKKKTQLRLRKCNEEEEEEEEVEEVEDSVEVEKVFCPRAVVEYRAGRQPQGWSQERCPWRGVIGFQGEEASVCCWVDFPTANIGATNLSSNIGATNRSES